MIWTKGTFLTPQHLQLQDRFLEDLLEFNLENLSFRPWGFATLQVSREALADGVFGISAASGLLPDGLMFDIPGSDGAPPLKQLAECFEPDQTTLDIYLAVPQYRERGLNVASSTRESAARFRAEVEMFRDENTGASEKPVQVARKNLRLLVEGENRDGYSALRVARVQRDEAGAFQLDPRFVPPLVDFAANDYLLAIARRLVEILATRSSAIAGMRRQKNQTLADFTAADIANFWLLYTVNTAFPTFRHLSRPAAAIPRRYTAPCSRWPARSLLFPPTFIRAICRSTITMTWARCFTDLDEKLRCCWKP